MKKKFAGVVIPMITPFTEEGGLDRDSAVRIFKHITDAGTIPFLLGTTGEAASITAEMKTGLVRTVMGEVRNGTPVFAGVSNNCLKTSLELASAFSGYGVDAVVAHLPSYFPLSADQMESYFKALADASPLPVILYNILSTTHMSIPLEVIEKLSRHPNIAGLKDSERDLNRMKKVAEMFSAREDFSIMCGWTLQSHTTLFMGFDGIVPNPGNAAPGIFQDLYRAVAEGDRNEAEKIQSRIVDLANIFQKDKILSQVLAGLKVMMAELGLCGPWVLPPLTRLRPDEEDEIRNKMKQWGLKSV